MANLQIIRDLCRDKNITLKELAKRTGLSQHGLQIILRNNSTKVENLEKFAQILNVPISVFFEEPKNKTPFDVASDVFDRIGSKSLNKIPTKSKNNNDKSSFYISDFISSELHSYAFSSPTLIFSITDNPDSILADFFRKSSIISPLFLSEIIQFLVLGNVNNINIVIKNLLILIEKGTFLKHDVSNKIPTKYKNIEEGKWPESLKATINNAEIEVEKDAIKILFSIPQVIDAFTNNLVTNESLLKAWKEYKDKG